MAQSLAGLLTFPGLSSNTGSGPGKQGVPVLPKSLKENWILLLQIQTVMQGIFQVNYIFHLTIISKQ